MIGKWSESCTQSYVSSVGISTEGINKSIDHCNRMKTLKYITEGESIDKDMKMLVLSDYKVNADKYNFWNGVVDWNSSLSLDIFCDVVMHLIFLGITKASRDFL
jgi:hypothetical protein